MFEPGLSLLRARYRLVSGPLAASANGQTWLGVGEDDSHYLLKVWPFNGERPDDFERALWDAELRTLYRVGSSPGAEQTILVLKDAGVDHTARCFAMVLQAPGYEPLSFALLHRGDVAWLSTHELPTRRALWTGLHQLAAGIRLLHDQNILHRDVRAESVYFNSHLGPTSLRLGGFEWSVRLGSPDTKTPTLNWSSPPEFFGATSVRAYRPETDWYAFGMLAARLLINVEAHANSGPAERHAGVLRDLERSGGRLSDLERAFILRLVAGNPNERISRGYEVLAAIQDILQALARGTDPAQDDRPLVLAINQAASQDLIDRASALGFLPNTSDPHEPFNPNNVLHTSNLSGFLQQELSEAQLYAVSNAKFFLLVGGNLTLTLTQFESMDPNTGAPVRTWDFAFCHGLGELRWNEGGPACVDLPRSAIVVRTRKQITSDRAIRQNARSWEPHLPRIDKAVALRASLARFQEFIRCTNQLELLIRDSELFSYRVVQSSSAGKLVRLEIEEMPRKRKPLRFCEVDGGLTEFLVREVESNKPDCRLVVLTTLDQDALTLPSIDKADCWTVSDIDGGRVFLERVVVGKKVPVAPQEGTLRTWGMFGQVALIRRRKRAIDRIERHSYLLRSLSAPGQVYMDTGHMSLPVPLSVDLVDDAKQAAIGDILRVRPIYALQGPPGTGKTTLVAHLLRQIFDDDPVAQVLITAQAHGAVDVLRAKVRDEAFKDVPDERQPLAVRLGLVPDETGPSDGSVEQVSLEVLQRARSKLEGQTQLSELQQEWLKIVTQMERAFMAWRPGGTTPDFCELVRRGANITYCTTSAGDLEALAEETQSFDWAIVEEAGKAHGFDLALPLQAGHRWLLIGDHKQLPPYRFKDYRSGIDALDEVVGALEDLPERAGNLLDIDWIRGWRDRSSDERAEFQEYARQWLNTFARVFEYCSIAPGELKLTLDEADGAAAGMLSRQHRMHPTIGDLISNAYYKGDLVNRTLDADGHPLPRVQHPFVSPAGIEGKAVVWLDVPWAKNGVDVGEVGPRQGKPRYTNPTEVDALESFLASLKPRQGPLSNERPLSLAVLSPYNQQVALINRRIKEDALRHSGLELKPALRSRLRDASSDSSKRVAYSVDSFQGNQADVIAVSLVRNNDLPVGEGLGFLEESPRINVLLSRAERLLVLVGSWEFFQHQLQAVSLDDPQLPLWHWKKVLATLYEWFADGRALRIESSRSQGRD